MNAFFFFDLFMVYLLECKQQLRTMKQYDQIPDIVHLTLNLGCSFIPLRELDVILHAFIFQIIYTGLH
jgi:hypothetical protein